MVLILTNTQDPHADRAVTFLAGRSSDVFRLNTEDFLYSYTGTIEVGSGPAWKGHLVDELGRQFKLDRNHVAWIRRPDFTFAYQEDLEGDVSRYILSEYRSFVHNLYSLSNITFINDHFRSERAKNKITQLILAQELGMRVPRTIVTNNPTEASEFVSRLGAPHVLTKPIYTSNFNLNGVAQGLESCRITTSQFYDRVTSISLVPTKIQEYVEKLFELRVIVIGEEVFAVKIDSQVSEETKIDWRQMTKKCPHSIFDLPDTIRRFCTSFLKRQELKFGAMDFIVTPSGDYVFLENNPAGQYLWLEDETGIPLTEALCELFLKIEGAHL